MVSRGRESNAVAERHSTRGRQGRQPGEWRQDRPYRQRSVDPVKKFRPGETELWRIRLGAVEEWTIRNESDERHDFPIHQGGVQLVEENGVRQSLDGYYVTINVPVRGEVKVISRSTGYDPLAIRWNDSFCPPTEASYMSPPSAMVTIATPSR